MNQATNQKTKLWLLPQFDNLELFRAKAIHYHYARHFHASYSIGVIEAGVGGNYHQGATYLAPPKSIVLMNPEEAHTGFLDGRTTPHLSHAVSQNKLCASEIQDPSIAKRVMQNPELTLAFFVGEQQIYNLLPELPNIQRPTLVMAGKDEPIIPIEDVKETVAALPSNLMQFVPFANCGHRIFPDNPQAGFQVLREFLLAA